MGLPLQKKIVNFFLARAVVSGMINNMQSIKGHTMRATVLAFSFLSACVMDLQENPDYATVHGTIVFAGDYEIVTQSAIEAAHEAVITTLLKMHPEDFSEQALRDSFDTLEIDLYFVDSVPDCGSCLGRTVAYPTGGARVYIKITDGMRDLSYSALTHELIHVAHHFIAIHDQDHNEENYFRNDSRTAQENAETVETKANLAFGHCSKANKEINENNDRILGRVSTCATCW